MTKFNRCPHCKEVITFAAHSGDIVHECNSGDKTIDEEDILVIGNWSDHSGSGTSTNPMLQGMEECDEIQLTDRGNRAATYRQRQRQTYIEDPNNTEKW